ncbi:MAG: DUF4097 domain-containing protein [Treponemataceae bacterium]|nr:DUF4097 domain-containing protein [Treponemataceae bacterium]
MKPSRFFLSTGAVLLVLGLIIIGISFIMGGNWDETLTFANISNLSEYYKRNDNNELDSDALIWAENEKNIISYDFSKEVIKNLEMNITNADIIIQHGDLFSVSLENIKKDDISCKVTRSGTIIIDNASNRFSIFNIFRRRSFINRGTVILYVPEGLKFENIELISHTGSLVTEIPLHAEKTELETESGSISIMELYSGKTSITTASGIVYTAGALHGKTEVKCGSGAVEIDIKEDKETYSYSADSGMGEINVDGFSYTGSKKLTSGKTKDNNIRMNCGSGRIKISFE